MFETIVQSIPEQVIHYENVTLCIKRLDLVHPQISGNKFFKLKYNLLSAQQQGFKRVLTFGGAYSNHIAATAYAAHLFGFESIGIIRGEELQHRALNPTLATAQHFGMQLQFISRERYREKNHPYFLHQLTLDYPDHYIIPEGGTNALAIKGCTEILTEDDRENFDLICCAVGTGGTITGLIESSAVHQTLLGFSALKGDFLHQEVKLQTPKQNWQITDSFCFGGYAKSTPELLQFIKNFERKYGIPLEQVYTGKMLFGIFKMIEQGHIQPQQRILVIHTGGLQGKKPS
ncbi:1-aminocyclopropane-1-carboxylate deaminase [Acinetobacter sp. ANC 5054]|uniref:1-aminocyclopropane-1-carboxylate deaminase/D-cysteine desulfhydrase n=1 Tax=Acinetobacter sp. ANC 5054 TaxID=1977877 RepID=UPI000A33F11C|nr:pyridoxal-phosphate dependent enzyme [Acinetobacter sp. ANC 5054]OTG77307.1 1-aminocyclopropane-1-carboxylate deaminase [Acinetobacter sp. ANC 5054]